MTQGMGETGVVRKRHANKIGALARIIAKQMLLAIQGVKCTVPYCWPALQPRCPGRRFSAMIFQFTIARLSARRSRIAIHALPEQ